MFDRLKAMTLHIYKASAGSGKTYRLTEEYLKLVIENPDKYRKVLAITFTNKATEEMKSRILRELHKLSIGENSNHKSTLLQTHKWLTEEKLQTRSKEVLQNILYNYNHFNISTIDSFFQKIIKNFSKELGIKLGYNIELDNSAVLSKAIDLMLQEVGKNTALTNWLVSFTQERIEDGKSWQIKSHIEQFGKELFKEKFQQFNIQVRQKLEDKDFLKDFLKEINQVIHTFQNHQEKLAKEAIELIDRNNLTVEDFSNKKSGVAGHFFKIVDKKEYEPGKRAMAAIDDVSKWYSKSQNDNIKNQIEQVVDLGLNRYLKDLIEHFEAKRVNYSSALNVKRYFNVLGILTDLSAKISEIREDESILLISDVNQLLNQIIDKNDTPFIYEKTGSRYEHFLIDEFQDTSEYQWSNLKPLVSNSLDSNNFNLVVGDVKQSIYRWRNGDWNLLNQKIYEDIDSQMINTIPLTNNFRSEENIIKFNNSIFNTATTLLSNIFDNKYRELITKVYSDSKQIFPKDNDQGNGFIRLRFFEGAYNKWKEEVTTYLPTQIDEILSNGFEQKDICILVRNAKDGNQLADILFNTGKYDVISKDSLFLKNSSAVRVIISAFTQIIKPDDSINIKNLISEFKNLQNEYASFSFFESDPEIDLPIEYSNLLNQQHHFGLQELAEKVIDIFNLSGFTEEHAYILAFQDAILEFQKGNPSDINLFLDWWNEKGKEKTIQIPGSTNAIQIMTIHKSKGLDFNVVMIPYFNWNLDHNSNHDNVLWCNSEHIPFNKLDLLPIRYSSKLENTVFNSDYQEEKLNTYVDNLNLMYVAFTRAKQGLVVFGAKARNDKISTISELLCSTLSFNTEENNEFVQLSKYFDSELSSFELGDIKNVREEEKQIIEPIKLNQLYSNTQRNNLKVRYDAEDLFDKKERSQLNYGKFMHEVLSNIYSLDDIDNQIEKLFFEGKLDKSESDALKKKLNDFLDKEPMKDWFSNRWTVKNESPILKPGNEVDIPDRIMISDKNAVVIDFKFGKENKKYKSQVEGYKTDLKTMGYDTKGYLVYFENDKIVEV